MTHLKPLSPLSAPAPIRRSALWIVLFGALAILALLAGKALIAQVSGERGIAPVASSSDIEAAGIAIDVTGENAQAAREEGWKLAQRLAWKKLGGTTISDSDLDSMVSAVVIEKEQIGQRRYIATLGVIFDRQRAGGRLGAQSGKRAHSAPMLTVPVFAAGGTRTVYEVRNVWQRAWAEYQAGASAIDYVRPSGAGADSLLLNYGQLGRRSRSWWTNILEDFDAADVLIPIADLKHEWPGGPVVGHFTARFGPDRNFLESFTMKAASDEELPAMLAKAIARFDRIYTTALDRGLLKPDPTLSAGGVTLDPAIAALLSAARRAQQAEEAGAAVTESGAVVLPSDTVSTSGQPTQVVSSYVVQFVTPDAGSIDAALGSVRSTPGVRGAATSSIAIGGTSVMRVSYAGEMSALAAALSARGWRVTQGSGALAISR